MTSSSTDRKEIRKFGGIAWLLFGTLCALGYWRQKPFPVYFFGTLSTIGLSLFLLPGPLRGIYKGWLAIARFIGSVITGIMLTIAYYLVITPSAILKRLFSGRPLPWGFDREADSYWIERSEPVQPAERFVKRY